jgi:hypothetical protein
MPYEQICLQNCSSKTRVEFNGINLEADRICLEGSKFFYNGSQFDLPGRMACACFVTEPSEYKEGICSDGQQRCPDYIPGRPGDSLISCFNYLVNDNSDKFNVPDGCCPPGHGKWILNRNVFNSSLDSRVCGCAPPSLNHSSFKPEF